MVYGLSLYFVLMGICFGLQEKVVVPAYGSTDSGKGSGRSVYRAPDVTIQRSRDKFSYTPSVVTRDLFTGRPAFYYFRCPACFCSLNRTFVLGGRRSSSYVFLFPEPKLVPVQQYLAPASKNQTARE